MDIAERLEYSSSLFRIYRTIIGRNSEVSISFKICLWGILGFLPIVLQNQELEGKTGKNLVLLPIPKV